MIEKVWNQRFHKALELSGVVYLHRPDDGSSVNSHDDQLTHRQPAITIGGRQADIRDCLWDQTSNKSVNRVPNIPALPQARALRAKVFAMFGEVCASERREEEVMGFPLAHLIP